MRLALVLCLLAAPALSECPPPADNSEEMSALIERANAARSPAEGQRVAGEMWRVWLRAPDDVAQEALDAGMRLREVFDFAGALEEFDRLAAYCPDYAEGFNQRAFVNFLREDYAAALPDLDVALRLSPDHVAAQAGRALTLLALGRPAEARAQLLEAVANNPWLAEAALLEDGAPLGLRGEEL